METEQFKNKTPDYDKLEKYGFKKSNNKYIYEKELTNKEFKIQVIIENKKVISKIIEIEYNQEYNNINYKELGEFTRKIKEEYDNILKDIKNKCFKQENFIFPQTNRITEYIIKKYKTPPEFLWENNKGSGIFRNKQNKKWFSIIMDINKSKIDKEDKLIEIINTKIEEKNLEKLLTKKGYYKAYHMNKKTWITMILDDTIKDDDIKKQIDESYNLINK